MKRTRRRLMKGKYAQTRGTKIAKNLIRGLCRNFRILDRSGLVSSHRVLLLSSFVWYCYHFWRFSRVCNEFLFARQQNSTAVERSCASLRLSPRLSFCLAFCTCSSVRWIFSVVLSDCLAEKPPVKRLPRIKFWVTRSLALWSAFWLQFLSKVPPLQLRSSCQWSLLGVSVASHLTM